MPKTVELFQRKVRAVPTASPKLQEVQKQAASYTSQKVEEARLAAATTDADVSVRAPLDEAAPVALSLSYSLGVPQAPWLNAATNLSLKLNKETSGLDHDIAEYAQKVQKDVDKKIEGTGLIRIGYFSYVAIIAGLLFLAWTGLKIYGMVNPAVGLGTNLIGKVSSKVLSKGFAQVAHGGELFKEAIERQFEKADAEKLKELFRVSQERAQDSSVKELVKSLTK